MQTGRDQRENKKCSSADKEVISNERRNTLDRCGTDRHGDCKKSELW